MRYIYCITNLLNGKTYFGQHKLQEGRTLQSDLYYGSGKLIKAAQKKYGLENFKKEILLEGEFSKEEINRFEKCIIACQRICGKAEYNITDGGEGCHGDAWYKANLKHLQDQEINKKRKATWRKTYDTMSDEIKQEWRRKISESNKGNKNWLGKHHSEESKKKIGLANSKHQKGEKNSQYGTHWYTDGEKNVKAKECPPGFRPGRI